MTKCLLLNYPSKLVLKMSAIGGFDFTLVGRGLFVVF